MLGKVLDFISCSSSLPNPTDKLLSIRDDIWQGRIVLDYDRKYDLVY